MDHNIQFNDKALTKLKTLAEPAPEGPLKDLLLTLTQAPDDFSRKNAVLAEFRKTLKGCQAYTPLEKDALCTSLETILEILKIESSDGLLNEWLHGISL